MIGDPEKDYDYLRSASPIFFVDKIQSPVLFIHGKNDTRVPVAQVEKMISHLKSNNKMVESLVFEDEGHIISKEENLYRAYETVYNFFTRNLI